MAEPLNASKPEGASRPVGREDEGGGDFASLSPLGLFGSVLAIVVAALATASLGAALITAGFVLHVGRDAATDFLEQTRFDVPLFTRLSAGVVSLVYAGFALATLGAAVATARRQWRHPVALRPIRFQSWDMLAVPAFTLGYAAVTTFLLAQMRTRHLLVSGPTDYTLIGLVVLNLGVLAPLAEELFFRGWLYTGLRARYGFWPSYLVTATLFAAIHWDANHRRILLVLPLALALGLLREGTGSIKPTVLLHAVYNLTIVAITLAET